MNLKEEIKKLKEDKNAVILVHNYQRPEVQEVGDFIGDSLELARKAAQTDADIILFAGVRFMAETAKILSPDKKVLLSHSRAGCPMADMVTPEDVKKLREKYPDAAVVAYVNTTADVKAEVDICCTSANAPKVVKSLKEKRVIFIPDQNLAHWVARQVPEKEIIPYDGFCYVHMGFTARHVEEARKLHPDAEILVHPECRPEVVDRADFVLSTSGMIRHAKNSSAKKFIIGTEFGLIYRLKKENPGKEFYSLGPPRVCWNMKLTTLADVYKTLKDEENEIVLPKDIMERAKDALEKMIKIF